MATATADAATLDNAANGLPVQMQLDPSHSGEVPSTDQAEWKIVAGKRRQASASRKASDTLFIGGLAATTAEEDLFSALQAKGIGIQKCHLLPQGEAYPDCVAFKAYVRESDVSTVTDARFWPRGIWCRPWRRPSPPSQ